MEHYSSIPPRPQSTICPSTSPWLMPVAQSSPMRQPTPTPTSNRDTSSFLYEPPRRNDYSSRTPMNSTRYRGLPGQPFKMPGLAPQAMATQWITPPGRMPFPFLQQSSLGQPRDSIQHSHWDPSLRPPDIERPMTYSQKEELACPTESPNLPCEGAESNEEKFTAPPPRCRELDPEIRKKLSSNLPPFKIPRGLEDDFVCIKRRELWESLVKDQYCPGAIQATIDGHVNFNALAYDIVFGDFRLPDCLPHLDPISLLEAFFIRINYERCQVKKLEELTYASADPDDEQKTPPTSVDCSIIEKCFKHKHPTELNAAIEKLLIAEKLHDFDKPEPEIPLMNLTLDKLSTDLPGTPITIQTFMGTTKPRNPT
ncbi:PREDICTED: uncharacterized protein LOC108381974 [Rhagoletis zephyria]|uniref:uncharacterized protein LOC108381974 n=1 Tax=Rhagoletis zephyria TaxID=28612 RepID=UPI0008113975|nr:PREDICTED: uncharacterized protein LOC108381974 [Rhagoletis zephyria]